MKIVWSSTGDWLDLDPTNYDLVAYWINSLDRDQINTFHLGQSQFDLNWPAALRIHIQTIDTFLRDKLKITALSNFQEQNLIDQTVLNELHRTWVKLLVDYPKLVNVMLHDTHNELHYHWNQVNKKLHLIEESFQSLYVAKEYWETPNIFGTDILNFNIQQIQLTFSQAGRSTFNKWKIFDFNMTDTDTNDFFNIGSEVLINLNNPESHEAPKEYVDFCNANSIPVTGRYLNLANFKNYAADLTNIRHVYLRNIAHENNTASFRL
jgi:hypothetical protein